jgi:hypothetical protein
LAKNRRIGTGKVDAVQQPLIERFQKWLILLLDERSFDSLHVPARDASIERISLENDPLTRNNFRQQIWTIPHQARCLSPWLMLALDHMLWQRGCRWMSK